MKNKTSTFAILQLTRLGDLVQTWQACFDFKQQYPDVKLVLIAREQFATPLNFLLAPLFDEIKTIPRSILQTDAKLEDILNNTKSILNDINKTDIDVLINFSFCETSNYLSPLIKCKHRLGTYIDRNNQVSVHDQWSQMIHTFTQRGPYCPFNLVDIFKNILGITPSVTNMSQGNTVNKRLAIHPFSSHPKKNWKAHKWTEVIYNFLKNNPAATISLFGAKHDLFAAKEITENVILKKFHNRINNTVGQLTLEQAHEHLKECSHFVGHDSLIGHLAKTVGLPTLTLDLGTVREIETVPYGENSFVLSPRTKCYPCFPDTKCDLYECHSDLTYQGVSSVLNQFVNETNISRDVLEKTTSPFHLNGINIYKSEFSNNSWLNLKDIYQDHFSLRDSIKSIYRIALSYQFEGKEEKLKIPQLSEANQIKLNHIKEGIKQLYELSEFGKKYSKYILQELACKSPSIEKIKEFSHKIEEIDQLSELILKTYSEMTPIIEYYKVTKSNLVGNTLVEITESSYLVYHEQSTACSIVFDLIGSITQKQKNLHHSLRSQE